jgi:hypothetical protein
MTVPNRGRRAVALLYGILALAMPAAHGQTTATPDSAQPAPSTAAAQPAEPPVRKWSIGIRVRTLPVKSFSSMDNGRTLATATVSRVNYDFNYHTTAKSFPIGGGLAIEGLLTPRTLLTVDAVFTRLKYQKVTDTYNGTDDPTTSNDERSHKNVTEDTQARLYDLPVLLHRNLTASGFLSHVYLAAGATARLASDVRTTTNITNADATTANSTTPAAVNKRLVVGGTVGVGLRFVDEFNIKVTPEVRYTRWNGATFAQDSTRSPRNQLEMNLAFIF